jgi:hypothetical protein
LSVALKFRGVLEGDVTRDASIDEFAGRTGDSNDETEVTAEKEASIEDDGVSERVSAVEPATWTSRYEPGGVACAVCETEVVRLWVSDGDAVCADCKSW